MTTATVDYADRRSGRVIPLRETVVGSRPAGRVVPFERRRTACGEVTRLRPAAVIPLPLGGQARRDAPYAAGTVPARPAVRLTVRGRLVLGLTLVGLVGGTAWAASASTGPAAGPAPRRPATTVVVRPGDTLWQVAGRVAPGVDRRVTVQRLRQLNRLRAGTLLPGQRLQVPAATG